MPFHKSNSQLSFRPQKFILQRKQFCLSWISFAIAEHCAEKSWRRFKLNRKRWKRLNCIFRWCFPIGRARVEQFFSVSMVTGEMENVDNRNHQSSTRALTWNGVGFESMITTNKKLKKFKILKYLSLLSAFKIS